MKFPFLNIPRVRFSREFQPVIQECATLDVVEPITPARAGVLTEPEAHTHPSSPRSDVEYGRSGDCAYNDQHNDYDEREALLARDSYDRAEFRQRLRQQRLDRELERRTLRNSARRHHSARRPRKLAVEHAEQRLESVVVRQQRPKRHQRRSGLRSRSLPTRTVAQRKRTGSMAPSTRRVVPLTGGPLQGIALATYFVLLPYVIVTKWLSAPATSHLIVVRSLLVLLVFCWVGFVVQLARDVQRLRSGDVSRRGGSAWLAGILVAFLPLLVSSSAGAATTTALSVHYEPTPGEHIAHFAHVKIPASTLGALAPLALVTRRKSTPFSANQFAELDEQIFTRVELLRSDPQVLGLLEPFAPTLRRRCVEMVAYLSLHRHEPVTGERLRTRVLTHADVDASLRTLANTASAVRRSLGSDNQGPRLHSVTSSGLYATHGVTSDLEIFTRMVTEARLLPVSQGADLARQALLLVQGEPLASALRGYEWFLNEGHAAALARDGEWAALVVHHDAVSQGRFELGFWALRQGLLIDPFSDVLLSTINKVPRLREFGSDRGGRTQYQPVSASSAVAMSWALTGFSNQVSQ